MTHEGMTNGFTVKSWSDVISVITILLFVLSGLVWGMKLEARYDRLEEKLEVVHRQIGNGILPRAEERVNDHERRLLRLEEEQ